METTERNFLIVIILIVLVAGSLFYYQNTQILDLNEKIALTNLNVNQKNDELTARLNFGIDDLKKLISSNQQQNDQKFSSLGEDISNVEQKAEIGLEDLESELVGIKTNAQGDFTSIIKDAIEATVSVLTDKGRRGSGAIIRANGKTVTNAHVISGASQIGIKTKDGEIYLVKVLGVDSDNDIAVLLPLNVNRTFDTLKYGDSDDLEIGERVVALGNPFGLDFTATQGIVSATNRAGPGGKEFIQTDVSINPGNSGGPLINDKGRIVGLNNWKVGSGEGLGFAIPSNRVEDVVIEIS